MADAPSSGGKGLKRRVGPLSVGGWAASVGGALVLFVLLKRYQADKARAGVAAGGGTGAGVLTGGGTVPSPGGSSSSPPAGAPFSSYGAWLQAAISQMSSGGLDSGQALDAITSWLNGQCVSSAGYSAITSVISSSSIGLPPGWGTTLPALSVCGTPVTGTTPPTNPYGTELFQGAGFNPGNAINAVVTAIDGSKYSWLPSGNAVQAAQSNGATLYYQPTPGNFQQIGPGFNQWANTPIFEKVG